MKWYEEKSLDGGVVLSSRIRLARNIAKYPFAKTLSKEKSEQMIEEVKNAVINDRTPIGKEFEYISMEGLGEIDKLSMIENHLISPELAQKNMPCGALVKNDSSVSIMINEEDHIRIQTMMAGYNIDKAWDLADKIDNLIGETINYAFDKEYGYLTSCVTNAGTGLRASFMLHIPMLEKTGQLRNIVNSINKFGMTIRGIYGEGSEPLGSIYQISNQITLGKSERDIIEGLKNVVEQIIEKEQILMNKYIENNREEMLDKVYRAYGLLSNCKIISSSEAIKLLSDLRMGIVSGLFNIGNIKANIYNIMMNVQAGNLQNNIGKMCNERTRDIERATYINRVLA